MLNVVIIGAGNIGSYIASMLSKEQQNVVLIDKDPKKLEEVVSKYDIAVKKGSGTNWQLLDDLLDLSPDFLLALTPDDEINLTACSIAKNLGYPKTISRVKDDSYLNRTRLDFARVFDTDYFICPEILVANEIQKFMLTSGCSNVETFAHGAVQLRTFTIPGSWKRIYTPIRELDLPEGMIIGLIKRGDKIIFPHGDDVILPGDEATCIGEADVISKLPQYFHIPQFKISSLVLIGGSQTALNLAKILQKEGISIRIIEKDYERCVALADQLPNCTIINQDGTQLDLLQSEKVDRVGLVIACTNNDETNMMASLVAKQAGAQKIAIVLSREDYHPIAEKLGLAYSVSPRLATANRLLSVVLSERVTTCVSLYENRAEVAEIQVSLHSKIVGIPINELGPLLPKDFIIAVIQNRGRILIAKGNRILSPGDSVIVVSHPRHMNELQKVF